jgi:Predicted AAA-ATPase.
LKGGIHAIKNAKKLPLNCSDFKSIIEDDNYFIDKSMLIHHLVDGNNNIVLSHVPDDLARHVTYP